MKRTGFVWFMIVITAFGVILGVLSTIAEYTGLEGATSYTGNPILGVVGTILNVISFVISIIYISKLYKMALDSIKWTNITFISYVVVVAFSLIGIAINTGDLVAGIISNVPILIIEIVLWILFYLHLKKTIFLSS